MAEGDSFAGWLKDAVNSVPILGAYTSAAWGQGNYDPNAAPTKDLFSSDATAMERIGSVINTIPGLHVAGEAVTAAGDNFAPLKFVLDFGNRTADSLFTAGAALGDDDETTSYFDGWRQGWNSWGTDQHLTAGQILGSSINNGFQDTGLSPFTQQGVQATQSLARTTWYGDLAGAATDIAAGFITPGAGVVKAARVGKTISTVADAEEVTRAFNAGERAGRTGSFFKPQAPQTQATRLEKLAETTFDRATSYTDAQNFLGPLTSSMSGRGQKLLADVAVTARRNLSPEEAKHAIGNAYLASMGSDAARTELMNNYPLIASKLANGQLAPQVLSDQAKAAEMIHKKFLADPSDLNVRDVVDTVQNTPRKVAEQKAILQAVDRATEEAAKTKDFRSRMAGLRPQFRKRDENGNVVDTNFDTARLRESRGKADLQWKDLKAQLDEAKANLAGVSRWAEGANKKVTSKVAMEDAAAMAGSKAGRDAASAFGPFKDAEDFNKAHGAAQQKVADLTQRLGEARADRDVLFSTPLDDPTAMEAWRGQMAGARRDAQTASQRKSVLTALNRTAKRELKDDAKAAQDMYPGLNATHAWLADLDSLGRGDTFLPTLKLTPSKLDQMKTALRDDIGASYLYDSGDFNRRMFFHVMPKSWVANIGTAYGRSAINVMDRYVGAQELGMYLKKSKVYSGDEIKAATEAFHQLRPGQAQDWVAKLHEDMLDRIFDEEAPHLSKENRQDAIGGVMAGMGQSREYLAKAADDADAAGQRWAQLMEFPDDFASDAIHNSEVAYLRSHLAETAPFADPFKLRKEIQNYVNRGSHVRDAANAAIRGIDGAIAGWKISQIFRPGMAIRNALDTNVRAYALMGTVPTMMSAVNGTRHLLRNTKMRVGDWTTVRKADVPALQKIGAQDSAGVVRQVLNELTLPNGQKISLHGVSDAGGVDEVAFAQNRTAMTKGTSPARGIISMGDRAGSKFTNDSKSWRHYKADDVEWPRAYADHAKVLLASPTARKVIESDLFDGGDKLSLAEVRREFFQDPAVRDEYAKLLDNHEMSQDQFIAQVIRETDIMFPEPGMAQDLLAGKFHGASGKKWIESHFPKDQRFDVPGEESIYHGGKEWLRQVIDKSMNMFQDEPDFYLGRNPVAFHAFKQQAQKEMQALYDSRLSRYGDNAQFSDADLKKIEARARAHAISTVREYMYDATKQTGVSATATLNRLIPFFAPFQDTMRAYSRLIYDDPDRLFKMAGLYNAPFNASPWLPTGPLIVDEYGNEVKRSERDRAGDTFMLINGQWETNKKTGRQQARGGFALRSSSFNTILQGEVPWLPGWGPAVQIPVQLGLNQFDKAALYLTKSDNPVVKTLMHSLFMDGEIPASDPGSLAKSLLPAYLRRLADGTGGVAYGRNVGYLMNQKYMEAQAKGEPFDQARALEESKSEAQSAALWQFAAQFGLGLSGDAQVQGKFYVQKMHEFQALAVKPKDGGPSPLERLYGTDDPAAVFADQFKEAKDLRWSFTRNETGISATVTAQNAAMDLKGLIDQNAELGWFIVGGDNVGGDFSQTAYNQQKQDTYGFGKGRKQLDADEIQQGVRVSQGWSEFTKYTTELSNASAAQGLDPKTASVARKAIIEAIGQQNPDWYAEYNNRTNRVQDFYQRADLLANDPRLAQRQDIAMYAVYRQAQQQVLGSFGLKSFAGNSANSEAAKWAMYQIGSQMARQNIGFQQMWERVLSTDVEPSEKQKVGADVG